MTNQEPIFESVSGPFTNEDAGIIGPALLQLERDHGEITKSLVLDEARQKTSPLHVHFLWDDTAAAEHYRLDQAGLMIRSIKIIVKITGGEVVKTRLLVNVKNQQGVRVYRSVSAVIADPDLCSQVINDAQEGLRAWKAKYTEYRKMFRQFRERFADVFSAIDDL